MNCADKCRKNGWTVGTVLAGDEGHGVTLLKITAIGEENILARAIMHDGEEVNWGEGLWTLSIREWRKV